MNPEETLGLPYSQAAEHAVIGAILNRGQAIDDVGALKPEHFYVGAHREIFRAMLDMSFAGKDIDVITLAEYLDTNGKTDVTGGLPYLGQIASNTVSTSVQRYAQIVIDKSMERSMLAVATDIHGIIGSAEPTAEKLNQVQALVMAIAESTTAKQPRKIGDALIDYVAKLEERNSGDAPPGLMTSLVDLDAKLNGLQDGNLIIVAGRPSMGKSAFTNSIAVNVAKDGHTVGIMSMEMTEVEQIDRVVATVGRVALDDVLKGNLAGDSGDRICAAIAQLQEMPLFIDEEPGLSAHQVMSKARQLKRKHNLKLLIVDALGLMQYDANRAVAELGAITKALKGLAKQLSIPIILLCQLSRKCEERNDKRPIMSDLRDSGNIEQDADVVLMLYRDEYYNPDTPDKGIAECLIRKARQGKTGVVPLAFIGEQTRFDNLAHDWRPMDQDDGLRKGKRH